MEYSDLEHMVNIDMLFEGFDYTDPTEIKDYWEVMLSDD